MSLDEALKKWETATDVPTAFHAGELMYAAIKELFPDVEETPLSHVFEVRCAYCLDEPFDVDVNGECPEREARQ